MRELIVNLMDSQIFLFFIGFSIIVIPIFGIIIVNTTDKND